MAAARCSSLEPLDAGSSQPIGAVSRAKSERKQQTSSLDSPYQGPEETGRNEIGSNGFQNAGVAMGHNNTITITKRTAQPALFVISLEKWRTLASRSFVDGGKEEAFCQEASRNMASIGC